MKAVRKVKATIIWFLGSTTSDMIIPRRFILVLMLHLKRLKYNTNIRLNHKMARRGDIVFTVMSVILHSSNIPWEERNTPFRYVKI